MSKTASWVVATSVLLAGALAWTLCWLVFQADTSGLVPFWLPLVNALSVHAIIPASLAGEAWAAWMRVLPLAAAIIIAGFLAGRYLGGFFPESDIRRVENPAEEVLRAGVDTTSLSHLDTLFLVLPDRPHRLLDDIKRYQIPTLLPPCRMLRADFDPSEDQIRDVRNLRAPR